MESGTTSTGIQGNIGRSAGKQAEAPEAQKCKSVKCAKSKQNPEVRRPGRYQLYHCATLVRIMLHNMAVALGMLSCWQPLL